MKVLRVGGLFLLGQLAFAQSPDLPDRQLWAWQALQASYPDARLALDRHDVVFPDGARFALDDGVSRTPQQLLDAPDLLDMFVYNYPRGRARAGDLPTSIRYPEDPGRVRVQGFFTHLYGASSAEVQEHLVPVHWLPSAHGPVLPMSSLHGAAAALQRVSDALDRRPDLWPFLLSPGGSYSWRPIAGTDRLSVHSFGIAVDINVARSDYWRDHATDEAAAVEYRNRIPAEIVDVFEQNGFLWGGWWYHFDTMHFEYRPELLEFARLSQEVR